MTKQRAPYGSWPSPISSQTLTQGMAHFSEPQLDADKCYWLETRPEEQGRTVIVCRDGQGECCDITPEATSVRTRIHEYGGGSYTVDKGIVYFVNNADQRIYCQPPQQPAFPLSPEGDYRYGDFCIDPTRQQLIGVCEIHHPDREAENCIVAVNLDGTSVSGFHLLAFGNDFYSNPRVSPDGQHLSWLSWQHPQMPWDNTECWLAEFSALGLLQKHRKVAGGSDDGSRQESVFQPQWSPTGELFFVSDRSQWWNLYRFSPISKETHPVVAMEAEFATPQWVFGLSCYSFINSYHIFCCYTHEGRWSGALIDTLTQRLTPINLPYNSISYIAGNEDTDTAVFIAASDTQTPSLFQWHDQKITLLAQSRPLSLAAADISTAEAISFHNRQGQRVHGFYYPPQNQSYQGPAADKPPLLVICHGGPTSATHGALSLKVQYWTSRGFAVFDINYSGSTGYGRAYRDRLRGQWGKLDVDDICSGADYLIQQGRVDADKVAVRGSSAGGFTVLAALTFGSVFKAGASLYGIGDLSLLASDTHKFESRYLDQLVGPYPEDKDLYQQRSPIHHVDQLNCPVIFLQGLEDKVVPPNQAETMVKALAERNIPVAYASYRGEGHGFRKAETIRHALEVEYGFYAAIFGFNPEQNLPSVPFTQGETA
ncbi:MAG: prolyl oligopeptidase family serine peptidase [Cellvibrionaceae bacterium]|nr:prolyl oligopeptidase family serine peptidase [Cellvibrionaceae bacterium]